MFYRVIIEKLRPLTAKNARERKTLVNYALSFLIKASMYSDLFFLVFKISAASCEIRTLIAKVRPVAGRPEANLLVLIFVNRLTVLR